MTKLTAFQARVWAGVLVALLATHGTAMAQGSAQGGNPGGTTATGNAPAAATAPTAQESVLAAFGPIGLAGVAVMMLLVRRRPMR